MHFKIERELKKTTEGREKKCCVRHAIAMSNKLFCPDI